MLPSEVRDLHLRSGQPVSRKGYDFNQRENFKFYRDPSATMSLSNLLLLLGLTKGKLIK